MGTLQPQQQSQPQPPPPPPPPPPSPQKQQQQQQQQRQGGGEPLIEPLTYKTWVLKVSIHCEGCKRKVKRVLHSIEGVYAANVDRKEQKVIVTGNIEAEILIKKLVKSGKHAQLWPGVADLSQRDHSEGGVESRTDQEIHHGGGGGGGAPPFHIDKEATNVQLVQEQPQNVGGHSVQVVMVGNPPSVTLTNGGEGGGASDGGGGGGGNKRKKKKKKGHKSAVVGDAPAASDAPGGPPAQFSDGAPPPVYCVSQTTAYPTTTTYTTSYHHACEPSQQSYAYTTTPSVETIELPPSDFESYPRQPLDSFVLLSEENPNGCSIM